MPFSLVTKIARLDELHHFVCARGARIVRNQALSSGQLRDGYSTGSVGEGRGMEGVTLVQFITKKFQTKSGQEITNDRSPPKRRIYLSIDAAAFGMILFRS